MAIALKGEVHSGAASASSLVMDVSSIGIAAGDFIVIGVCLGNLTSSRSLAAGASGDVSGAVYNQRSALYSNDSNDTNAYCFSGFATGADTSITLGLGTATPSAYVVRVYTGVDNSTPLDVAITTATGGNTDKSAPPAITPVTSGAVIVPLYFASQDTIGAGWTGAGSLTNFVTAMSSRAIISAADYAWNGSGSTTPPAILSSEASTRDSWAGITLALRPAPPSIGLTVAGATSASVAGAVSLSPKTGLTLAATQSATLAGAITLSPKTGLVPAATVSASQAGAITLSPKTSLTLATAVSASQASSITLSPKTALTLASTVSASLASTITLAVSNAYSLAMDSATSGSLSRAPSGNYGPDLLGGSGAFNSATGWTLTGADWAITGGQAVLTNYAGGQLEYHGLTTTIGRNYHVEFDLPALTGGPFTVAVGGRNYGASIGHNSYTTDSPQAAFPYMRGSLAGTNATVDNWTIQLDEELNLSYKTTLTLASETSASQLGAVVLSAKTALVLASSLSASQASAITLSPKTALAAANDNSASQLGAVTLAAKTAIAVSSMNSASLASSATILQSPIAASPSISASQLDAVLLSPKTALVLDTSLNSASTVSAVNVVLKYGLAPASLVSAGALSALTLAAKTSLSLLPTTSASLLTSLSLINKTALLLSELRSPSLLDNVIVAPSLHVLPGAWADVDLTWLLHIQPGVFQAATSSLLTRDAPRPVVEAEPPNPISTIDDPEPPVHDTSRYS